MTVRELAKYCNEQIRKGNGDKTILISADDEGNEFHGLYYSFTDELEVLKDLAGQGLFHDYDDPHDVVILG